MINMKFYEIQEDHIINLFTVRTAQVLRNEICISFTCGDTRSDRIIFGSSQAAADAFDNLCDALGMEV